MKSRTSLAIADDHPLIISGLVSVLKEDFEIVGTGNNGVELLHIVREKQPDLALIDYYMPQMDGAAVSKEIISLFPKVKCVILSSTYEFAIVPLLKQLGVKGYFNKSLNSISLPGLLKRIAGGETIFEQEETESITNDPAELTTRIRKLRITQRELEIIRWVCKGYTSSEIGNQLFISGSTVETHRKNIYKKLGIRNLQGLIGYANEHLL